MVYSAHTYPQKCIYSEGGREHLVKNQTGVLFDMTSDGSEGEEREGGGRSGGCDVLLLIFLLILLILTGVPIRGDIMIRVIHKSSFKKVQLFQFSFHTYFHNDPVMRLPFDEVRIIITTII